MTNCKAIVQLDTEQKIIKNITVINNVNYMSFSSLNPLKKGYKTETELTQIILDTCKNNGFIIEQTDCNNLIQFEILYINLFTNRVYKKYISRDDIK